MVFAPSRRGALRSRDPHGPVTTAVTERRAVASGVVRLQASTLKLIRDRKLAKGDVLEVARLAGIMAVKRTADIIPLCHPLPVDAASVDFSFPDDASIRILATDITSLAFRAEV